MEFVCLQVTGFHSLAIGRFGIKLGLLERASKALTLRDLGETSRSL
jgi:hypothetical protein